MRAMEALTGASDCVVVHYSEIGVKGKNRSFFERKLMSNLDAALAGTGCAKAERLHGRIVIGTGKGCRKAKAAEKLGKVPGVSGFSFAISSGLEMKDIIAVAEKAAGLVGRYVPGTRTFAVSSVRSDKRFGHTSKQLNEMLGDRLRKATGWKVDLSRPDVTFFVEVTEKRAFFYTGKSQGMGGLPVTSSGKLVCLLSGGIDSPVAAVEMMKRGCEVVLVHFHNHTRQKDIVKDKVSRIAEALSDYQPRTKLYMVPFGDLQRAIVAKVPARYRMIAYRRVMQDIANRIARREKAMGFVTGDSVGQVASQTLENLAVIRKRAQLPVYSPLIGCNKEDIVGKAKAFGTYEISILPYSDCCSFLVAAHPETKASAGDVEKAEAALDIGDLVSSAVREAEKLRF